MAWFVAALAAGAILLASRIARASRPSAGGDDRAPPRDETRRPAGATFRSPFSFLAPVTSGWGDPRPYRHGIHEGLDFDAPEGTPIYAMESGTVRGAVQNPCADAAGKHVTIVSDSGDYRLTYMHLSTLAVGRDDHVAVGQQIGTVGKTGGDRSGPGCTFGSAAPHLHLTIRAHERLARAYPATLRGSWRGDFIAVPGEPLVPARYGRRVAVRASDAGLALAPGSQMA